MIRIGSRGSALALWQSQHIRDRLLMAHQGIDIGIEIIHTTGDKITDVPLSKIGDKALFTKEIDRALLENRVHIAVHSLKDVPTRIESGLALAAVAQREDPRDALVTSPAMPGKLHELPPRARVGTSSLRRRAQLLALRPDLEIADLRGNVDTRLAAVRDGKYDAIILAFAGMKRLGREAEATELLDSETWLPAVGQGALGVLCRANDTATQSLLRVLDDADTHAATDAERALLRELEGGCQIPVAALGRVSGERLHLRALVASLDGRRIVRGERTGAHTDASAIGRDLAHDLMQRGAREILEELRAAQPPVPQPAAP